MTRSKIRTSGAEGLTLSSTDITIDSGDLLFGTSAKGVNLGVTSNTDGNTLDDYEEGTWTPSVSAGAISGTSTSYSGTYTKIGRSVLLNFKASSSLGDVNVSSYVGIAGVPFTILADKDGTGVVTTEDIDEFDRQGFAAVQGTVLYLSNCGSSSGTGALKVSITAPTS